MRRIPIAFMFMLLLSASCATIIHGPIQMIEVTSKPAGAVVSVDGRTIGRTPLTFPLQRRGPYIRHESGKYLYVLNISKEGYSPYEIYINRRLDPLFLGNIFIGGIGMFVDSKTGSSYFLNPAEFHAVFNHPIIEEPDSVLIESEDYYYKK